MPGDKSISHRALLLGALGSGRTTIRGLAPGDDCRATRACLVGLGLRIAEDGSPLDVVVEGRGLGGFAPPTATLDAGNSGTTARLLMGILAGHAFPVRLDGDDSLRRRPMRRVAHPLELMGARLEMTDGRLPISIHGGPLRAIAFEPPVASAQVKSAILLAGLHARGRTSVVERIPTRDHTERLLRAFGVPVRTDATGVHVDGGSTPGSVGLRVPGDPSSAAFWAAAAAALPGSEVEITGVGLNPTRIAFLDILRRAGAEVTASIDEDGASEPSGTLRVRHGGLKPFVVAPAEVPGLIDELPALAAMASMGGAMSVRGAAELRVKESDRISSLAAGLRAMGAEVEEYPDGFAVNGARPRSGGIVDAAGDHRLVMAFAIAALGASGPTIVRGAGAVTVSYPGFFDSLEDLSQ